MSEFLRDVIGVSDGDIVLLKDAKPTPERDKLLVKTIADCRQWMNRQLEEARRELVALAGDLPVAVGDFTAGVADIRMGEDLDDLADVVEASLQAIWGGRRPEGMEDVLRLSFGERLKMSVFDPMDFDRELFNGSRPFAFINSGSPANWSEINPGGSLIEGSAELTMAQMHEAFRLWHELVDICNAVTWDICYSHQGLAKRLGLGEVIRRGEGQERNGFYQTKVTEVMAKLRKELFDLNDSPEDGHLLFRHGDMVCNPQKNSGLVLPSYYHHDGEHENNDGLIILDSRRDHRFVKGQEIGNLKAALSDPEARVHKTVQMHPELSEIQYYISMALNRNGWADVDLRFLVASLKGTMKFFALRAAALRPREI